MNQILISHRGNISGPNKEKENTIEYINETLKYFAVEIDVWLVNKNIYLGHDSPETLVDIDFLKAPGLWCHAKNIAILEVLLENHIHCFYHQNDDVTLTSRGFIWTFPGKELTHNSIAVMPETKEFKNIKIARGICSDFIAKYK